MFCYRCHSSLEKILPERGVTPREAVCPKCLAEVRVCRNCQFYDPSYYNHCRENSAERVVDKEKANYCEFFSFPLNDSAQLFTEEQQKEKIVRSFDSLFNK